MAGGVAAAALTRSATVGRVFALRAAASAAETARTSGLVAMAGASVAVATLSSLARVSHSVELGIQTSGGWMAPPWSWARTAAGASAVTVTSTHTCGSVVIRWATVATTGAMSGEAVTRRAVRPDAQSSGVVLRLAR